MSENQRTVWITGAGGLIGNQLVTSAPTFASSWRVVATTRNDVDLAQFGPVEKFFNANTPDLIIHCAAMSRSPDCQKSPKNAQLQNVEVTRHLAQLTSESLMVFMSTDLVFDGRKGGYVETDTTNPMSVYAETKLAAEEAVLKNPRSMVIRTSLNCGRSPTGDRGMDEQLITSWRNGVNTSLFEDEYRCPIPVSATAQAIWELVDANAAGIYHVAGSEKLSRWKIGQLLTAKYPEYQRLITRSSLKSYDGAPRSPDTSLNCDKAQALLSFQLPTFSQWVQNEKNSTN